MRIALRCPDKKAPEIHSAIWGRQDGAACPPESDAMSCSSDVTDIVNGKCTEKKCAFKPNKRSLDTPCDGNGTLIIKVDYSCRPIATEGQCKCYLHEIIYFILLSKPNCTLVKRYK